MPRRLLTVLALILSLTAAHAQLSAKRTESLRLQILLDQLHFGPGILDGKPGTFTKLALDAYKQSFGGKGSKDDAENIAASYIKEVITVAEVPKFAAKYIDPRLPDDKNREAQGKFKYMSYRSYVEFMAERYHTSEDMLTELNSAKAMKHLMAGHTIKVPNVAPFKIEEIHSRAHDIAVPKGHTRWVVVDTANKQLRILQSEKKDLKESAAELIAAFPITPGKKEMIRRGKWKLKNSVPLPTWRYDQSLLKTGHYSKEGIVMIPPGPNNPVGIYWLGLSVRGIGLHGTNLPRTIGRAQSSGCVRLSNWDIMHVPRYIKVGDTVIIQ